MTIKMDALVPAALLGSSKEALKEVLNLANSDDQLSAVLARMDHKDGAEQLLTTAGTIKLHAAIGHQPFYPELDPLQQLAPEAERGIMPEAAGRMLRLIAERQDHFLMRDVLTAMQARGWRLPPELLPHMLTLAEKNSFLRPYIIGVLDRPGRWLAGHNPAWGFALFPVLSWADLHQRWLEAPLPKRRAMLTWFRTADPPTSLALIKSVWKQEKDSVRQNLISCLSQNLTMVDEPFLEMALNDRHHAVRRKARELLSRLPESRYMGRIAAYTDQFLKWTPYKKKETLEIKMPRQFSASQIRDGLTNQMARSRSDFVGRRLSHMVTATPLDKWTTDVVSDIEGFLKLLPNSNWNRTLTQALINAAERQKRTDWLLALMRHTIYSKAPLRHVHLLDPTDLVAVTAEIMALDQTEDVAPLHRNSPAYHLMNHWKSTWPEPAGRQVLQRLLDHIDQADPERAVDASLATSVTRFISLLPADMLSEIKERLRYAENAVHPTWPKAIQNGIRKLEKRAAMAELFYSTVLSDE